MGNEGLVYGTVPRRWRVKVEPGKHPIREAATYFYGCYFPQVDFSVGEGGVRGTGMPKGGDVEWLDPPAEIWVPELAGGAT